MMWRFADRYELHMLVQSARGVARGPVARLVAAGGRNSHEWTPEKNGLLQHLRRKRHHRRVSGPGTGRVRRRAEKSGAGADRV